MHLSEHGGDKTPFDFVESCCRQHLGRDLAEMLNHDHLYLLADALNEMPRQGKVGRVNAWQHFVADWPGHHFLFTCRTRDYEGGLEVQQVEISPLDEERIGEFLRKYRPEQAEALWAALQEGRGRLMELARNPYLLTMLTFVLHPGEGPARQPGSVVLSLRAGAVWAGEAQGAP